MVMNLLSLLSDVPALSSLIGVPECHITGLNGRKKGVPYPASLTSFSFVGGKYSDTNSGLALIRDNSACDADIYCARFVWVKTFHKWYADGNKNMAKSPSYDRTLFREDGEINKKYVTDVYYS